MPRFTIQSERSVSYVKQQLAVQSGIEVTGSVALRQQYDVSVGVYTPDWASAAWPGLQPWCSLTDLDDSTQSVRRAELTDWHWYEIIDGVSTEITDTTTGYQLVRTGDEDGRLYVKKNCNPGTPVIFRFTGKAVHVASSQVYEIDESVMAICEATDVMPRLTLNVPQKMRYYPARDYPSPVQRVTPSLSKGAGELPVATRIFRWEIWRPAASAWTEVGTETIDELVVEVQPYTKDAQGHITGGGSYADVHRDLVGEAGLRLRVSALYDADGRPWMLSVSPELLRAEVEFEEWWPRLLEVGSAQPRKIGRTQDETPCKAWVRDPMGLLTEAQINAAFRISWHLSKGTSAGTVSFGTALAYGIEADVPTTGLNKERGGKLAVRATPYGDWAALALQDGKVLTVMQGGVEKALIVRTS